MALDTDFERSIYAHQQAQQPSAAGTLFETFADRVLARVDQVIAGQACAWEPSSEERELLRHLRNHVGLDRSVSLRRLGAAIHTTEREVKEIVQNLRMNYGVLIGASRSAEGGYYLISSPDELALSTDPMMHQAVAMLRVVSAMRYAGRTAELIAQLKLELEKEAA